MSEAEPFRAQVANATENGAARDAGIVDVCNKLRHVVNKKKLLDARTHGKIAKTTHI